jgi:uncharacterized protein YlaI
MIKERCWQCGSIENISRHHVIPQRFRPKQNITIPLCRNCHDKIDSVPEKKVADLIDSAIARLMRLRKEIVK